MEAQNYTCIINTASNAGHVPTMPFAGVRKRRVYQKAFAGAGFGWMPEVNGPKYPRNLEGWAWMRWEYVAPARSGLGSGFRAMSAFV